MEQYSGSFTDRITLTVKVLRLLWVSVPVCDAWLRNCPESEYSKHNLNKIVPDMNLPRTMAEDQENERFY